jgi:hypothetical protein
LQRRLLQQQQKQLSLPSSLNDQIIQVFNNDFLMMYSAAILALLIPGLDAKENGLARTPPMVSFIEIDFSCFLTSLCISFCLEGMELVEPLCVRYFGRPH